MNGRFGPPPKAKTPPAQEIEPHCRQILRDHHEWIASWLCKPHSRPCVFGDVLEQVAAGAIPANGNFQSKLQATQAAHLQGLQHCYEHGHMCSTLTPTDLDVSGLPCQDNSRANRKENERKDSMPLYIWSGQKSIPFWRRPS